MHWNGMAASQPFLWHHLQDNDQRRKTEQITEITRKQTKSQSKFDF